MKWHQRQLYTILYNSLTEEDGERLLILLLTEAFEINRDIC